MNMYNLLEDFFKQSPSMRNKEIENYETNGHLCTVTYRNRHEDGEYFCESDKIDIEIWELLEFIYGQLKENNKQ